MSLFLDRLRIRETMADMRGVRAKCPGDRMSEYLPREVRQGLEMSRKQGLRRKSRLRVRIGDKAYTILRYWDGGFALDSDDAPQLRGRVNLYDGGRHLSECLIVASAEEAGEMVYEFKRETRATETAPRDYVRDEAAPAGLIEKL